MFRIFNFKGRGQSKEQSGARDPSSAVVTGTMTFNALGDDYFQSGEYYVQAVGAYLASALVDQDYSGLNFLRDEILSSPGRDSRKVESAISSILTQNSVRAFLMDPQVSEALAKHPNAVSVLAQQFPELAAKAPSRTPEVA